MVNKKVQIKRKQKEEVFLSPEVISFVNGHAIMFECVLSRQSFDRTGLKALRYFASVLVSKQFSPSESFLLAPLCIQQAFCLSRSMVLWQRHQNLSRLHR